MFLGIRLKLKSDQFLISKFELYFRLILLFDGNFDGYPEVLLIFKNEDAPKTVPNKSAVYLTDIQMFLDIIVLFDNNILDHFRFELMQFIRLVPVYQVDILIGVGDKICCDVAG